MDTFLEDYFSEDSNGLDNGEAEAALYSFVHHSEETYSCSMLDLSGNYISKRNKANRWETIQPISDFVKPENYILQIREDNCTLDHIPFCKDNTANTSKTMYGQQYSKRGKFFKYAWNNQRSERPWNVEGRMRNFYRNRNPYPVYSRGKQVNGQHFDDPQELLTINHFGSFENSPSLIRNELHTNFESRRDFEPVILNEGTLDQGIIGNCKPGSNANKSGSPARINPYLEASGSKQENVNVSGNGNEGANENGCEVASISQKPSTKNNKNKPSSLPLEKNVHEIINILDEIASDEVVIVSENDDSNSELSIMEVSVPPKPAPPVIAVDSSDEAESSFLSNANPVLSISEYNDEFAVEDPNASRSTSENCIHTKDSVLGISSTSKKIKKKKKKKTKLKPKSPECATWTSGMIKFYNHSWGGETYDHVKLQMEMTNNPTKWQILDIDKYGPIRSIGPRVRCANCHQYGHFTKQCPDPKKIKCCAMCGQQGHHENQCPNKICLKCGRPARLYNEGCPSCWDKNHPKMCTECGGADHFQWLCPNVWRKFHSITTTEDFQTGIVLDPVFKSPSELACCICAEKGHIPGKCPLPARLSQSGSPSVDRFAMQCINKKRKKKRGSYIDAKKKDYDYNRKRRKTN